MSARRAAWLIVTLTLLVLAAVGPALAAEPGVIRGRIVNGTADAVVPSGLTATLDGFRATERLPVRAIAVAPDGMFEIRPVETGPEYAYVLTVEYLGASYSSRVLTVPDGGVVEAALTVYEVTHDDPGIALESITRLLRRQTADALSVVEIAEITVPGDRTYTPQAQPDVQPRLRFAVPDGGFNLQPISGFSPEDVVIGGPGFAVFAPLAPGLQSLVFGYQIAIPDGEASFDWRLALPAGTVRLLTEAGALDTEVRGLESIGEDAFGDLSVQRWETQGAPQGASFAVRVRDTRMPGLVRTIRATTADRWGVIAGGLAVALAALLAIWRRSWRGAPASGPEDEARRLGARIAELDAASRGAPAPKDQRERRRRLKSQLVDLVSRHPELAELLRADRRPGASPSRTPPAA